MHLIETPYARLGNGNCIAGRRAYISDSAIDLVQANLPYGLGGDELNVHYNQDECFAIEGYVEVGPGDYPAFIRV